MTENVGLRIVVTPEPTDAEKAALAAAVIASVANVQEDEVAEPVDKWREAGKRESLREHMWETQR